MQQKKLFSMPIYSGVKKYKEPMSATVKDYGGRKKKLTVCKMRVRQSGLAGAFEGNTRGSPSKKPSESDKDPPEPSSSSGNDPPPATGNQQDEDPQVKEREACNLSRARSTIYELALCNDWEWFFTFTLDPTKYDRTDLKKFRKDLSRFIRNYRSKKGANVKYLLVPEQHSDGESWHMHGFLMGLPESHLKLFRLEDHLPYYIRRKLSEGQAVYDWDSYHKKFGFCDIEPIRDLEATAKYATKYISKSMDSGVIEAGGHLYYASQGLKRAVKIADGYIDSSQSITFEYENEYVKLKWFDGSDNPEKLICSDNSAERLREKRDAIMAQGPPAPDITDIPWSPMWDMETGEIFEDPFNDPGKFSILPVGSPKGNKAPDSIQPPVQDHNKTKHKRRSKADQINGQQTLSFAEGTVYNEDTKEI